jgi:ubiquinone/menaquinone biosynthesis C-methylase UbiE
VLAVAVLACVPPLGAQSPPFPRPDRPVASIVSSSWDQEHRRDEQGEAERVFRLLELGPGMRVADIGAGSGYYTARLAKLLGPGGVVYAEDIQEDYVEALRRRVVAESLTTVQVNLGEADDARLPAGSVDVALLSHMYHEIENPYALLWHLWPSLAPGGRVAIIDLDRATDRHGTPPRLLRCEFAAIGYREVAFHSLEPAKGYLAVFEPGASRPEPGTIRACPGGGQP